MSPILEAAGAGAYQAGTISASAAIVSAASTSTASTVLAGSGLLASVAKVVVGVAILTATVFGVKAIIPNLTQSTESNMSNISSEIIASTQTSSPSESTHISEPMQEKYSFEKITNQAFYRNPYLGQRLGANPIYYVEHPSLDLVMDLTENIDFAQKIMIVPKDFGFGFYRRAYINVHQMYEVFNAYDVSADYGFAGEIIKLNTTDALEKFERYCNNGDYGYHAKSFEVDGSPYALLMYENVTTLHPNGRRTGQMDITDFVDDAIRANLVEDNYFNQSFTFENLSKIIEKIVHSKAIGPRAIAKKDSAEEIQQIQAQIQKDPLVFELQYGMLMLQPLPNLITLNLTFNQEDQAKTKLVYNWTPVITDIGAHLAVEAYEDNNNLNHDFMNQTYALGTADLDLDNEKELIVKGQAAKQMITNINEIAEYEVGYIAIFKQTDEGLLLSNAFKITEDESRYVIVAKDKIYVPLSTEEDGSYLFKEREYYFDMTLDEQYNVKDHSEEKLIAIQPDQLKEYFERGNYTILDTKLDQTQLDSSLKNILVLEDKSIQDLFANLKQAPMPAQNELEKAFFEYTKAKDLGPDFFTEFAIYDLDEDGQDEYILHVVEISTTSGSPQTQTWEIFKAGTRGLEIVYKDYFGANELTYQANQVFSYDQAIRWQTEQEDAYLVRRQPLAKVDKPIGAFESDWTEVEKALTESERVAGSLHGFRTQLQDERILVFPNKNHKRFLNGEGRLLEMKVEEYPNLESYLRRSE